ncbi:MAG: T9SS type A sorting domain-containing protein [Bacteroidales bacterium]|nr:T9SS type A sorting domain-containing protein [Bacteroidales bacterium]
MAPSNNIYLCGEKASILYNNVAELPSSILDEVENHLVNLFPNPASEYLNLNASNIQWVKIYNSQGKLVFSVDNINEDEYKADISCLNDGVWICVLKSDNGVSTSKFIKL